MYLYIKRKAYSMTESYNIYDANQNPVYEVIGELVAFGAKIHLRTMRGDEQFSIRQTKRSTWGEFEIYQGELLCAHVRREFSSGLPKVDIHSQLNHYRLIGDLSRMQFHIEQDGQSLGSVSPQWMAWADTYRLDIRSAEVSGLFCSLFVAVDRCLNDKA